MEIKKTNRFILIAVTVFLLVAMLVIQFATNAVALEGDPTLRVKSFALSLENNVCMDFKVSNTNVSDPSKIQLLVWLNAPEEYKKGTENYTLTSKGTETGTGLETFQYENFSAKQMTEMIYVCAYVNENGVETYSDPAKFSIAMYAYLKRNATNPDAELVALLDSMLAYGAMSQQYFGYNLGYLATDETCQINVVNGKLSDGFTKGWYKKGTEIVLTADEPADGYEFSHWETSTGEVIETNTVIATNVNETYTAVYNEIELFIFTELSDGTYSVSRNPDAELPAEIVIPATYKDKAVTSIGSDAFSGCCGLTRIDIPNSVHSIGQGAFGCCCALESIIIPVGVTSIGDWAFHGCNRLKEISIPDGVGHIGEAMFYACNSLTSITIPSSVTSIGGGAFYYCSSLTSISVRIGNTVYHSNGNCLIETASKKLILGCKNSMIPIDGSVTSIGEYAFYGCSDLTNISIPNSVTSIGDDAFTWCGNLTSITIPNSVTSIGGYAFSVCSNLSIFCEAASCPSGWDSNWNPDNCPVTWGYTFN